MIRNGVEASIVILTYNGGEIFRECLRMVSKQKAGFTYEVIIVDSGSTDGTLNFLKGYPVRLKQIRPNEFNHGLTRNMAIALARGKYVILMTQDAIPAYRYWLENILENFKDESVAGVYCRQIPREDADVLTKRNLGAWVACREDRVVSFIEAWKDYEVLEPMKKLALCAFDNVCSCLRKSIWEEFPFTDARIAEDLEWGKKAIKAGYKIVYEPRAAVIHSHSRTSLYEYKRTYLCHRRLFQLFGLQRIRTLKQALQYSISNILKDAPYVMAAEKNWKRKFSLILRIPFLSFASIFGQYMGARDERLGNPLKNFRHV